jgi:mono/diheme cytochrome c family protein
MLLRFFAAAAGLMASAAVLISCTQSGQKAAPDPATALASRGKLVYQTTCIACHSPDPTKPGALGPEVWGSSLELLEARIVRTEYPKGYSPKRSTHVMQALPQVQKDIPALHAYLNSH